MAFSSLVVVVLELFCHLTFFFRYEQVVASPEVTLSPHTKQPFQASSDEYFSEKKSPPNQQNQTHVNSTQLHTVTAPEKLLALVVDWSLCLLVASLRRN